MIWEFAVRRGRERRCVYYHDGDEKSLHKVIMVDSMVHK